MFYDMVVLNCFRSQTRGFMVVLGCFQVVKQCFMVGNGFRGQTAETSLLCLGLLHWPMSDLEDVVNLHWRIYGRDSSRADQQHCQPVREAGS